MLNLPSNIPSILWLHGRAQPLANNGRELALNAMRRIDVLSNQRWHFFRKLLNVYDFDSREIAVNRAFYKLWELLSPYQAELLEPASYTLHLAEAPGSFVQVVQTMHPTVRTVAVSKPPSTYADVVRQGKAIPVFSPDLLKLERAQFHYFDLSQPIQIERLVRQMHRISPLGFQLITGDGGFDEEERYEEKEVLHYKLILGEIVCILLLQKLGGTCMLKVFDTFTITTASILYLLCRHYRSYEIVKPSTSRPTNSERYIVCRHFMGHTFKNADLLELLNCTIRDGMRLNFELPESFVEHVERVADKFAQYQAKSITDVITYMQKNEGNVFIDKRIFTEGKSKAFALWKSQYDYIV